MEAPRPRWRDCPSSSHSAGEGEEDNAGGPNELGTSFRGPRYQSRNGPPVITPMGLAVLLLVAVALAALWLSWTR